MSALPQSDYDLQLMEHCVALEHKPREFIESMFPWGEKGTELENARPRKWLLEVADYIELKLSNPATRHEPILIAVASGHGIGKSAGIGQLLCWALGTYPEARGTVTANTKGQLDTKTSPEVSKWFRLCELSHWFHASLTRVSSAFGDYGKSWRADFMPWSKENSEAFQGLHNAGKRIVLVFDEASKIHDVIWDVAEGAMTDAETQIIWIVFGNPTQATGRFRECFRKFRKYWYHVHIDSRDVEGTNQALFRRWAETRGTDSDFFKVRVLGQFPSMSLRGLFDEEKLSEARGRHLAKDQYAFAPITIGVDPAWEGDDELVIGARQGLMYKVQARMAKNDDDIAVAGVIARLQDKYRRPDGTLPIVNIDQGWGTGIKSAGKAMGRNWNLIPFNAKAPEPGFANMRAWMHWKAAEWVNEGGSFPEDHDQLFEDLAAVETESTIDGSIKLVPKDDMKELLGRSPNDSDCLALTFATPEPVLPGTVATRTSRDDNPLRRRLNR